MAKKPLLTFRARGTLTWKGHTVATSWKTTVASNGEVLITFRKLRITKGRVWLYETQDPSRFATWSTVNGRTAEGATVISDYVTLASASFSEGSIKLVGKASRLDLTLMPASGRRIVEYFTVGLEGGFTSLQATVPEGEVTVTAPYDVRDYNQLAGIIQIAADDEGSLEEWLERTDRRVLDIVQIQGIAQGHAIRWSIRQVRHNGVATHIRCYGLQHGDRPFDPVFNELNLQPIFEVGLAKYTQKLKDDVGLELAIGLYLMQSPQWELRFLGAMTSLEHLMYCVVNMVTDKREDGNLRHASCHISHSHTRRG